MKKRIRAAVITFPGSNCDWDCFHAAHTILNADARIVWHKEENLSGFDLIFLPGGFSYGDYLRSGAIARFSPVMAALEDFVKKDKGLVLGICNGFQILTEAGILPGALQKNKKLKFLCKNVHLRVENTKTPFTAAAKPGQILNIPIAHFDGNYMADRETLLKLNKKKQIVFRYYGDNPNGSCENIAGICNEARNVLGMMPHPERATEMFFGTDGKVIFESILRSY